MSVLSQFIGGDNILVGQSILMQGAMSYFTNNNQEYLRNGFLKSYTATYAPYKNRCPSACYVDADAVSTSTNIGSAGNNFIFWDSVASKYFLILGDYSTANGGSTFTSTDLLTWTSEQDNFGAMSTYDAVRMGNKIIRCGYNASNQAMQYRTDGTPNFSQITNSATTYRSIASNPAGTLAVALTGGANSLAAGNIETSTNGTTWTQRTGTGVSSASLYAVTWSPAANAFLFIGSSGTAVIINKTTDGYTQTNVLSDTSVSIYSNYFTNTGKHYIAHSPSVTLIVCDNGKLKRTTDGTSWTTVDITSQVNSLYLSNNANRRILYDPVNAVFMLSSLNSNTWLSSPDGITWTPKYMIKSDVLDVSYSLSHYFAVNNQVLGAVMNGSNLYKILKLTAAAAKTNPDWVGGFTQQTSNNYGPYIYTRIA